ncbi:hypothetical protein DdX_13460 [Ditylenchus destructor]|uniref:Uncharacterized protein n=1 Tax=Ditylenchus destructor TaxID=166010 RepID=A0AAD4MWH5_9BILA|nr:hypothetical protein DdX_13460 [Ditylenchus destructor]
MTRNCGDDSLQRAQLLEKSVRCNAEASMVLSQPITADGGFLITLGSILLLKSRPPKAAEIFTNPTQYAAASIEAAEGGRDLHERNPVLILTSGS